MWYQKVVHKTVAELGLTFRMQNNVFKFGKLYWKCNEEKITPIYEPNVWQHKVAIIDEHFYRYDCHDKKLSKYLVIYLVEKHEYG